LQRYDKRKDYQRKNSMSILEQISDMKKEVYMELLESGVGLF
jgi:hypothetical protein